MLPTIRWGPGGSLNQIEVLVALLVFTLVAAFALHWAWRRPSQHARSARLIATGVAVAALLMAALQPEIGHRTSGHAAILITPGATETELARLPDSLPRFVYRSSANEKAATNTVSDAAALLRRLPSLQLLRVVGAGLPSYEWPHLTGVKLEFDSPRPPGWQALTQSLSAESGQWLTVQGRYVSPRSGLAVRLRASSGLSLDSVPLASDGRVVLSARAPNAGVHLWTLDVMAGSELVERVTLPVTVAPVRALRVQLRLSAPSFEARFFRDWAQQAGHRVAIWQSVSRARASSASSAGALIIGRFTTAALRSCDVLVLDGQSYLQLDPGERSALAAAVQAGLGVLLLADGLGATELAAWPSSWPTALALRADSTRAGATPDSLLLKTASGQALANSPRVPLRFASASRVSPIIFSSRDVRAGAAVVGQGTWAVSLVSATHAWQLAGRADLYADYWAYLLRRISRPHTAWSLTTYPKATREHEPVCITLTGVPLGAVLSVYVHSPAGDSVALACIQDSLRATRWSSVYWPRQEGWHEVLAAGGQPLDTRMIYVLPEGAPSSLELAQRYQATRAAQAANRLVRPSQATAEVILFEPLSPWLAWALFVLAAAFLWIERKLFVR